MPENTQDTWSGTGYDAPASSGGLYLRLKDKDQKVRLRMCSEPFRFVDEIKLSETERKVVNRAGWIAIYKEVVSGKPNKRVVVFQAGPMVYGLLKDLAENDQWGDPKLYDVEITRTEQAGKYYTVAPLPKPIGPLSEEDALLVSEANLDLEALCLAKGGSPAKNPGDSQPEEYNPFDD